MVSEQSFLGLERVGEKGSKRGLKMIFFFFQIFFLVKKFICIFVVGAFPPLVGDPKDDRRTLLGLLRRSPLVLSPTS